LGEALFNYAEAQYASHHHVMSLGVAIDILLLHDVWHFFDSRYNMQQIAKIKGKRKHAI